MQADHRCADHFILLAGAAPRTGWRNDGVQCQRRFDDSSSTRAMMISAWYFPRNSPMVVTAPAGALKVFSVCITTCRGQHCQTCNWTWHGALALIYCVVARDQIRSGVPVQGTQRWPSWSTCVLMLARTSVAFRTLERERGSDSKNCQTCNFLQAGRIQVVCGSFGSGRHDLRMCTRGRTSRPRRKAVKAYD